MDWSIEEEENTTRSKDTSDFNEQGLNIRYLQKMQRGVFSQWRMGWDNVAMGDAAGR
jgi:hypothetical protein